MVVCKVIFVSNLTKVELSCGLFAVLTISSWLQQFANFGLADKTMIMIKDTLFLIGPASAVFRNIHCFLTLGKHSKKKNPKLWKKSIIILTPPPLGWFGLFWIWEKNENSDSPSYQKVQILNFGLFDFWSWPLPPFWTFSIIWDFFLFECFPKTFPSNYRFHNFDRDSSFCRIRWSVWAFAPKIASFIEGWFGRHDYANVSSRPE